MEYNISEGKDKLIEIIREGLGWEPIDDARDYMLTIITPFEDISVIVVGNLLFSDSINVEDIENPLDDPRGVRNRTVIIKRKGTEVGLEKSLLSARFRELFCPLERKDPKFRNLFAMEEEEVEDEEECWFENLRPEDAELFVDAFYAFLSSLKA